MSLNNYQSKISIWANQKAPQKHEPITTAKLAQLSLERKISVIILSTWEVVILDECYCDDMMERVSFLSNLNSWTSDVTSEKVKLNRNTQNADCLQLINVIEKVLDNVDFQFQKLLIKKVIV